MKTKRVMTLKRKAATKTGERRVSVAEGIALGEQAVREGRTVSHAAAKKLLARWFR